MSSAAARAEARRKAILSRGTDRLSKLTSSARGEDNPVYVNNEPQLHQVPKTENFIGDESVMSTPQPIAKNSSSQPSVPTSGAATWSEEEQHEFLRALMAAPELTSGGSTNNQPSQPGQDFAASATEDPMVAMLNALAQVSGRMPSGLGSSDPPLPGMDQMPTIPKTKSFFSKIIPVVHLLSTWALLAFFVVFKEPETYANNASYRGGGKDSLSRWAELAWRNAKGGFGVQSVHFFWAFAALQLVLHSIQMFSKVDPVQPPTVFTLALPYLPPNLRSILTNGLAYVKIIDTFYDDIAGLIFGTGLLIWIAAWLTGRS